MGIVSTLVASVVGSITTYQMSNRQLQSAADQSAVQFNREQRVSAYANYNNSVTNLGNDEYLLAQDFAQFPRVGIQLIHTDFVKYEADFEKNNLYSSTVGLVRSQGVGAAHGALGAKHNDLHNRLVQLNIAAEQGDVTTVQTKSKELIQNLDSGGLVKNFVAAAKHDLGMDN